MERATEEQRDFARSLRRNITDAERKLWYAIRKRQLDGAKFRRQAPVGDYVVDFICVERRLIIELDGGQHNEPSKRSADEQRTRWLNCQGYHVLRFWNFQVLEEFDDVLECIWQAIRDRAPEVPSPRPRGEG